MNQTPTKYKCTIGYKKVGLINQAPTNVNHFAFFRRRILLEYLPNFRRRGDLDERALQDRERSIEN
jgi:hypothetical protein